MPTTRKAGLKAKQAIPTPISSTSTMPTTRQAALKAKQVIQKENVRQVAREPSQLMMNPNTEVIVVVNQKQSLNIIQTSVAASLSAIMYIRDIFPGSYFEHRTYNLKSPDFTYAVTPSDPDSIRKQRTDESSVTWDILVPGHHKHVDKLLQWLDGISEAIKLKYLSTLVISLHHSYLAPDTLAEAYVLNFSYEGPDQQPRVGFTLGNDTVDVTLRSHQDMKKLFERLISLAGTHKIERPEYPAIGMQLTYNASCPEEYQPPGFRPAPPSQWINETGTIGLGEVNSGYHKLQMSMFLPSDVPKTPSQPAKTLHLHTSPSHSPTTETSISPALKMACTNLLAMVAPKRVTPDTQLVGGTTADVQAEVEKNTTRRPNVQEAVSAPKASASLPPPPASNGQPNKTRTAKKPHRKIHEMSLDEDDEDDDLSTSRPADSSSGTLETAHGSSGVVKFPQTSEKRKAEDLHEPSNGMRKVKRSFQNSPFLSRN